jgi:tetratricopeptide (TPR) repeat protein
VRTSLSQRSIVPAQFFFSWDFYAARGLAYTALGKFDSGKKDLDTALKIDPQNVYVVCSRARVRIGLRDEFGAIADCDNTLKIDPQFAGVLLSLKGSRRYRGKSTIDL